MLCLELQKHLNPLRKADIVSSWYDREIKAGSDWTGSIKENLASSDIILFLISPDFLNSEYIYENEIRQAIEQHNSGTSIVVPIMLRKCDIEFTPFRQIQGLPTDLEPINSKKWYTIDDAMFDVVEGLKKIILKTRERKSVLTAEESLWEKAMQENSIESYLAYLKESRLKIKIDEALNKIGDLNAGQFKDRASGVDDKLEIELLQRERERIAMELHDNVGSRLALVKFLMLSVKMEGRDLEDAKLAIDEVMSVIRQLSRFLRINYNDNEFDLKVAILELQSMIIRTNKMEFELVMNNVEDIKNSQLEVNIYRIIQELVSNVIKHSGATNMLLSIEKTNDFVIFSVKDNGKSFDLNNERRGIGLKNIKSRVDYYNGKLGLSSNETGTSIEIQLPIAR